MPSVALIASADTSELVAGFQRIRDEQQIPTSFPDRVNAEAEAVAARGPELPPGARVAPIDATQLELVTIDPASSTDLDQAFAAERRGDGYRVWYAIADVAMFVAPGSALDTEARERGVTRYSPDGHCSLHPEIINGDSGSLLPAATRPSVLWRLDLDAGGQLEASDVRRAWVRSRAKLSYEAGERLIEADEGHPLALLREIGQLRQGLEAERGAISLQLPTQEITYDGDQYGLTFDTSLPIEGWNAQISLLTGMAAAELMVNAGIGLLRTLPPLDGDTVAEVRRSAKALEIPWTPEESYPDRMRRLDPNVPREATLLTQAARSFRGAGYHPFVDGQLPDQPLHGAIGARYAHVTAPLRRLCDRFANEIVLAECGGYPIPTWASEALDELPRLMGRAQQSSRALENAMVDYVEAMVLRDRVGSRFTGVVLSHDRSGARVQIADPAVVARIDAQPPLGSLVDLTLVSVDTDARTVSFAIDA